jgi:hypothetical protein
MCCAKHWFLLFDESSAAWHAPVSPILNKASSTNWFQLCGLSSSTIAMRIRVSPKSVAAKKPVCRTVLCNSHEFPTLGSGRSLNCASLRLVSLFQQPFLIAPPLSAPFPSF